MRNFFIMCLWALAGIIMAGDTPDAFHQDSRAPFVKLDFVKEEQSLVRGLSGEGQARKYLRANAASYGLQAELDNLELKDHVVNG